MEHVPIFKEDMKNGVAIVDVIDPYNYMIFGKVFRGKGKYPCCLGDSL